MNPEKFKFKWKDLDLKDFYDTENKIDSEFFKKYLKDIDWNLPNNIQTTAVKSSFNDMSVIIGMDYDGQMHIIKNERGDEGLKYVNINVIMKMFIKALRAGIMRFTANNKFNLFSEVIEKELEYAIINVVNKYDLNRVERTYNSWEPKQQSSKSGK